jgi:hypothetical protein
VQKQSSYVCRLRDNSVYEVVEQRELSEAAVEADVLSDQIVLIGQASKNSDKPNHKIRLIQIRCTPHKNRTGGKAKGSRAPDSDGILRIATNLSDVPAEIIALIYAQRWIIETNHAHYVQRFTFSQADTSDYIGNQGIIGSGAMVPAMPA